MNGGGLVPLADDDPVGIGLDPDYVLPRRIASWAKYDPDRSFMVEVTGRQMSYGEFFTYMLRWCTVLRSFGVGPGERVVSMLAQSIDAHALWLAASCVGAIEVPVNPELRGSFLEHALSDPGARLCFVRPEHASIPGEVAVDGLEVIAVPRDRPQGHEAAPAELDTLPAPTDPSCTIYTSGTTGPSKGVVISWAQMSATIGRIPRSWLSAADAVYSFYPMFHVTGRSPLPSMVDVGGRVVLRERFSASEFWGDVDRFTCTSTTVNPSLLLAAQERGTDRDNPLRIALTAGNRAYAKRFAERFDVHMVEAYGSTEIGFPIVLRQLPDGESRTCGWLRRGYEGRIVGDNGEEIADATPGELYVRPATRPLITLGYLGKEELTRKAVVDGWFRTGDRLFRRSDGSFEFVDRMRDTIRHLGENISSSALEAAVLADPEVSECAAIGVPNPTTGQDVLLAITACSEAGEVQAAQLYERLAEQLPRYMLPTYIVVGAELPRTPTNKVRKSDLLDTVDLARAWGPSARA